MKKKLNSFKMRRNRNERRQETRVIVVQDIMGRDILKTDILGTDIFIHILGIMNWRINQ